MRKIKLFITLLISGLPVYTFAQTDYYSGFLVDKKGDTIRGLIQYSSPSENSKYCKFKAIDGEVSKYYPSDISEYCIDKSSHFISRELDVKGAKTLIFLEWLVKGKLNTFMYVDSSMADHYLVQKEGGELKELKNTTVIYKNDKYLNKREYIGELNIFLQDAPALLPMIQKSKYNYNSMIELSKEYHNMVCNSPEGCIVFERPKTNVNIIWGVFGELYNSKINNLQIKSLGYVFPIQDVQMLQTIAGGVFFNFSNFDKISKRISLVIELGYMKANYKNSASDILFGFSQFRTNIQAKYTLPFSRLKPSFALGISPYYRLSNSYTKGFNDPTTKKFILNDGTNYNFLLAANCQIGIDYEISKSIVVSGNLRYEFVSKFVGFLNDESTLSNYSLQFGVGYRIM